jgi:hypothetical protein
MQSNPAPGQPARLRTMFRVLFDDDALYVGVRLEDPASWAIQAPLGHRDIYLWVDTLLFPAPYRHVGLSRVHGLDHVGERPAEG